MNLTTAEALAEQFGVTVKRLHELRKRNRWPHVRLGRFDIRFTDEQIAQIVAMQTEAPAKQERPALTGQTARSATRRRSA